MSFNDTLDGDVIKNSNRLRKRLQFAHAINDFLFNKYRFFGTRKLGRLLSRVILPSLHESSIVVPTIYGFDLVLNKNGGLEIYTLGFYEAGTLQVMKNCLNEGDNVIDVGASIGLMSLFASNEIKGSGKVLSFEPNKERFEFLSHNATQRNNIETFNKGLGEKNEMLKLYTDIHSPSIVSSNRKSNKFEEVEILMLDEVIKGKLGKVKFIKIDVEGFEIPVLLGAKELLKSPDAPIICVEYVKNFQSKNQSNKSLYQFIKDQNEYRIFQLKKSSNTISKLIEVKTEGNLRDCDNMYCFLDTHFDSINTSELFDKNLRY